LFYWRHKILSALKQIPTEAFQDIVEMDETYFLYSEKGKRNITPNASLVNVAAKLYIVVLATIKFTYWLLMTVRKFLLWHTWAWTHSDYKIG